VAILWAAVSTPWFAIGASATPIAGNFIPDQLEDLLSVRWQGNLFLRSPFNVTTTYFQIPPDDERLYAGEVAIVPDARSRQVEISGELFAPRRSAATA